MTADNPRDRRAFTLVELLVVIAIIGILVALLLPAVQAAREAGRRAACQNNMKQIGTALQNYHSAQRKFPSNWGIVKDLAGVSAADTDLKIEGQSWLTTILPQLELQPLYDSISLGKGLDIGKNSVAAQTPVVTFICPSNNESRSTQQKLPSTSTTEGWAVTNYKACSGSNWGSASTLSGFTPDNPPNYHAKQDYTITTGRNYSTHNGLARGDGFICAGYYNSTSTNADLPKNFLVTSDFEIRDGLSNTFAFGESVTEMCAWSIWIRFDGSTATCGIPLNYKKAADNKPPAATDKANSYGFRSWHSSGANFGACDGSVQWINNDIDLKLYRSLATIDGDETVQMPE